ncbi:E3 ubiquitin-protein ligase RNF168-like [Ctenodactylus gundi]
MAASKPAVPSLAEFQCFVCLEILLEPVTFPCKHTLCKPCFHAILEKATLCCPLCHLRISSWARYHARRNSLINVELWGLIQKHYPNECRLRALGLELEITHDFVRELSKPGELRAEYEQEMGKMEAERQAQREEEDRASERYIRTLLAEEEEREKRQAGDRRGGTEPRKTGEQAGAQDAHGPRDRSASASPRTAGKPDPSAIQSHKKCKSKRRHLEQTQAPTPHVQSGSAPQPEGAWEIQGNHTSRRVTVGVQSSTQQDTGTESRPPDSPRNGPDIQEQGKKASVKPPRPQVQAYGATGCLNGRGKTGDFYVVLHRLDLGRPDSLREAALKSCRKTERRSAIPGVTQECGTGSAANQKTQPRVLIRRLVLKRKSEDPTPEAAAESGFPARGKERSPTSSPGQQEAEMSITQKLKNLEHMFFERHKQEEADRLLAIQLQKQMDKGVQKVNRQKGTPDAYQLRSASGPPRHVLHTSGPRAPEATKVQH